MSGVQIPYHPPFFTRSKIDPKAGFLPLSHPIYVLRHGETEWNFEGRLQGTLDSPLTPRGRAQAAAQRGLLARFLPHQTGVACWSSPQGRAWSTAQIACADLGPIVPKSALVEVSLGDWQGRTVAEIEASPEGAGALRDHAEMWKFHAPGGEDLGMLRARLKILLQGLDRPTVIVTHGVTSRVLRLLALDLPMSDYTALPGGQGVVFAIDNGVQTRWGAAVEGD
jgi:broad specificity phosphatase PhoE